VAAMAAIGAGVGPIIGGFLTTYASWRYAFLGEVLVVIYILFKRKLITDAEILGEKPKLDLLGVFLTVIGLSTTVYGILLASTYGFFTSRKDWVVGGKTLIEAGQISPTIILVLAGAVLLALFVIWEKYREKRQKFTLVNLQLFKNKIVNSGLGSIFAQQFLLGGLMYSLALYLQIELQYNALETGFAILPLSLMILVLASRSSKMSTRFAPKTLIRIGFSLIVIGSIWLGIRSAEATSGRDIAITLAFVGAGVGVISSQLQNLVQSAVTQKDSAEASGLMATFQNLGMSFGTAVSGVLLLGILIFSATNLINDNSKLSTAEKDALTQAYETKGQIVSDEQVNNALSGQSTEIRNEVVNINAKARQNALTGVFVLMGLMSALGFFATNSLPATKETNISPEN
jgi:MFS family permease